MGNQIPVLGMKLILVFLVLSMVSCQSVGQEIHVSKSGSDDGDGSANSPYLTISKAASEAVPGNTIIIHEGTYREYVDPPVGGSYDNNRITFKAAEGESVYVKGSEVIDNWIDNGDNTWKVDLEESYFNNYNPYTLAVNGDFQNYGQWHHRGDVYINNGALHELQTIEQVRDEPYTWYTSTASETTTIYANFGTKNPNTEWTEINVRELIFFTSTLNIDYITIDGLKFHHAAPNWQAPNTGASDPNPITQVGAVGSKMGKGWIIQNCEVMYSKTAGIMMGESFDDLSNFENVDAFGDHLIKDNVIHRCGEYGIAGQKGLSRSTIIGNRIEDINYRNEFGGYETSGIKIWNSVDVHIENNLIQNVIATLSSQSSAHAIWIDYANQGTRITRNVLIGGNDTSNPLYLEANIGPTLVDNNIIIDPAGKNIQIYSGGSILAHNLFINTNFHFAIQQFDNGGSGARNANTLQPHTLIVTNLGQKVEIEYNRLYNNIFAGGDGPSDFSINSGEGNRVDANLYIDGTQPNMFHSNSTESSFDFTYQLTPTDFGLDLKFEIDNSFQGLSTPTVNGTLIGVIPFAEQTIEDEDGNEIAVDSDFDSNVRGENPTVGPLQNLLEGTNSISIGTSIALSEGDKYDIPVNIPSNAQLPYLGDATEIPGILEAENYDIGGQGISFNDDNIKDGEGSFRPNDNVDLGTGGANGMVVAWINNGEWLEYTVNVQGGKYKITASGASELSSVGNLFVYLDDELIGEIDMGGTSNWNVYKDFSIEDVAIPETTNGILRLSFTGGFNLDRVMFERTGDLILASAKAKRFQIHPNPAQKRAQSSGWANRRYHNVTGYPGNHNLLLRRLTLD